MSDAATSIETNIEKAERQARELFEFVRKSAHTGKAAHEVERGLWTQLLAFGLMLLRAFFEFSGTGDEGEQMVLENGRTLKRIGLRTRVYQSIFGRIKIERFVYAEREKQKIEAIPLDARLKLPETITSFLLQGWNELLMLEVPYARAIDMLEGIFGFRQSMNTLERNQETLSGTTEEFWKQRPQPAPVEEGSILVNSVDGKGVPMRSYETNGESGKKKMAIIGAVYNVAPHVRTPEDVLNALFDKDKDEQKAPRPSPIDKHVRACLKRDEADSTKPQVDEMFDWIKHENEQRNPLQDKHTVVLIDGQENFWNATEQKITGDNVTEIIDIIHVSEYVWEAGKLLHSDTETEIRPFVKTQIGRILHGEVDEVVDTLWEMSDQLKGKAQERLEVICNYLSNNSDRMAYDAYLAEGFPIATGVIEGACRSLIKDRMERSGMRWVLSGARAMLSIRSVFFSGLWDEFMSFHINSEIKRLYNSEAANDEQFSLAA